MENPKGLIDYKTVLGNIWEEASQTEKEEIDFILSSLDGLAGGETGFYKEADKIIRKYRPDFFVN